MQNSKDSNIAEPTRFRELIKRYAYFNSSEDRILVPTSTEEGGVSCCCYDVKTGRLINNEPGCDVRTYFYKYNYKIVNKSLS